MRRKTSPRSAAIASGNGRPTTAAPSVRGAGLTTKKVKKTPSGTIHLKVERTWRYDIDYLVWNQPCACYVQKRLTLNSSERLTEKGVLSLVKDHTKKAFRTDDAKTIGWEISPA